MLEIIICDDNPVHNKFLCATIVKILRKHNLPGQVVLLVNSAEDLLSCFLRTGGRRLFLLDIHLGDDSINGIDVASRIREKDSDAYIVYVTAYQEYLLSGYKTKTFDFLLKPLNEQVVESMLLRLFKDYSATFSAERALCLKVGSVLHNIPYREIIYFEKMRNILYVHTYDNVFSSYESLKTIAERVPSNFIMCHKSYIVSSDKIKCWDLSGKTVTMINNQKCPVSRRFKSNLLDVMGRDHAD